MILTQNDCFWAGTYLIVATEDRFDYVIKFLYSILTYSIYGSTLVISDRFSPLPESPFLTSVTVSMS